MVKGDRVDDYCVDGCELVTLENAKITKEILDVPVITDVSKVVKWMYATSDSARKGRPLGDIYHASPVLVGPPKDEPADDSYTRFRNETGVKDRPLNWGGSTQLCTRESKFEINEQGDCGSRGLSPIGFSAVDMSGGGKTLRFAMP